jgi:phosphoribosyl 1,2-cyclic phosphate phosphodiesterase
VSTLEVTVLGCGSSSGSPAIGCHCPTCVSTDPRNRRSRTSALVRYQDQNFLIDTGPDLRSQALANGIEWLDAVLYTHPHADHLNGIDDLRAFCFQRQGPLPLYGNAFTLDNIRSRFAYALQPPSPVWDKPVLEAHVVSGPFLHQGIELIPVPMMHGPSWPCLGWRLGDMAWLTDLSRLPADSLSLLSGVRLLFIDCLRRTSYPSHLSVSEAFELAELIGAERSVLIHMTHELEFNALQAQCPPGVEVAYDGMRLQLDSPSAVRP